MTKEDLAKQLDGCEIGKEVDRTTAAIATKAGLVIVFGASDDLMEFEGAICDEVGAYEGGTALVDGKGLLPERDSIDDDEVLEDYFRRKKTAKKIKALWAKGGYSWTFKTDIPHATFDVLEDGEKYCCGIVFSLADVT